MTHRCSWLNPHSIVDHLSELDQNEVIIIQNLGAQNNRQVIERKDFLLIKYYLCAT